MQHRLLVLFGLSLLTVSHSLAQPLPQYTARQRSQIDAFRRDVQARFADNYDRAVRLANQLGRPLRMSGGPGQSRPGQSIELAGLDDNGNLYYVGANSNTQAGISTRTTAFYAGGSLGLSLNGSSESVRSRLGLWEVQGFPRASHVEFGGRINQIDGASTSTDDILHSTHVAGTLIAAGRNASARGMANAATIQSYNASNDVTEMTAASANLLISNHSYGLIAGWRFNSSRSGTTQWEWYGDTAISQTKDYRFGFYDSRARSWDQIAVNAPSYLIVTAATNNHGQNGPGASQPYYLGSSSTISTVPRENQNGYDQIPSYNQAKNVLTVGAVSTLPLGYNQPSDVNLASFSSWGPTDDGRIKPDIVGVGVSVLSTSSSGDSLYTNLSGTSMASPNVAGSLLLLQELYAQRNNGQFMRSSTLKGLAIHTADETGSAPGPDYRFGWGLLNMERAGRAILNTDQNYLVSERTLEQGGTVSVPVVASGRGPLLATICWTDPAGTPSSPTLDDRTPKLVNDLDSRISDGTTTVQPWVLDPANPANAATRGDNIRDNVEQVYIANPVPGRSYTISITHKGTLSNGPQNYALLVSGIGGQTYCASGATSNADTRISRVQFGSIDQTGTSGCTTYTDYTPVRTNVQPGQALPLTVALGTCGTTRNAVVKAFADWNQNGNFNDAGELLATSDVLPNSGLFTTAVTIPTTAQNGQLIRLRIVATETDNPLSVSACGNYGNGETQDYVLNVVQVANDVGPTALVSPEPGLCGLINSDLAVTVRVRNYGSANQTNVPVAVRITDADNRSVAFLNGTLPTLAAFREGVLTLRTAGITLAPGQTFRFQITTSLPNDQLPGNSTFTQSLTTTPTPTNALFSALRCGTDTIVTLRNAGGGTAFWYDAPTGGNLLAAGNQTLARSLPNSSTYFAVLNDFAGSFGPVDKNAFTGGSYAGNFGPAPLITTTVPLTIERARLYISSAGQLTFTVRRFDDTPISSVTLDVLPTRNTSLTATNSGGMLLDDPNDAGAEYTLNLRIPTPGDYKITIAYANGAGIFRSNTGVTGFPYRLTAQNGQPVVSSRGHCSTMPAGVSIRSQRPGITSTTCAFVRSIARP
ncbi:S8 family serine peptidase [Spirosoma montaniterrae]|uniref:S8 family serine peptidase n=1 Tax=Spirosoma montaniterrae TaxID=1178516 RepID=UPI002687EB17